MTRGATLAAVPPSAAAAECRSDGQLLEGFARRREEAAFEMLVHRHGDKAGAQ